MQLILVRHGEAEAYQANDAIRSLTTRGIAQAHSTAHQVLEKYQPDLLVASPYVRAQQTVAAFQETLSQKALSQKALSQKALLNVPLHTLDLITPDADPRVALDALSELQSQYSVKCMVVVCHMNVIACMAGLLLDEDPESFGLAEARVFEQSMILFGLSVEKARFVPLVDHH